MFSNFFNSDKPVGPKKYTPLSETSDLATILEKSFMVPQFIFKHSERCSISRWVLKQFENAFQLNEAQLSWHLVDVVGHRDLSQKIAQETNIIHESPQILIISKAQCIYNASHESISYEKVLEVLHNIKSN
jgi:bacillithiol system protein YtxJ